MDLSKYTKVEHEDGRIEFIPIEKQSEYLTVTEAIELSEVSVTGGGTALVGTIGISSVMNLDSSVRYKVKSNSPFKLYVNSDYELEAEECTNPNYRTYLLKKK